MARAPLARPTDAPPIAHGPTAATPGRPPPAAIAGRAAGPGRASCRGTSRSSWTATGAGPATAAWPRSRATPPASRRSARSSGTSSGAASRSSRCTRSAARTGPAPTTRSRGLFGLLEQAIRSETAELKAQGVRVRLLGRLDELPEATRRSIGGALDETAGGERLLLNVAFNYAGRTELVDAFRRLAASGVPPGRDRRAGDLRGALHGRRCRIPTS